MRRVLSRISVVTAATLGLGSMLDSAGCSSAGAPENEAFTQSVSEAVTAAFPKYDHVFAVISRITGQSDHRKPERSDHQRSRLRLWPRHQLHGGIDPSEPNYVAMLGGSEFGISTDWDVVETALDPGGTDIPLGITMSDSLVSICW